MNGLEQARQKLKDAAIAYTAEAAASDRDSDAMAELESAAMDYSLALRQEREAEAKAEMEYIENADKRVAIRVRDVGQQFGRMGELIARSGRVVATTDIYPFAQNALAAAEALAHREGYTVTGHEWVHNE